MFHYEFQPHKAEKHCSSSAKVIVLNVLIKLRDKNLTKSDKKIGELCPGLTGISVRSTYKVEIKTPGKHSTLGKNRLLKVNTQTRNKIYDEFSKIVICRKMHLFFFLVTVKKFLPVC